MDQIREAQSKSVIVGFRRLLQGDQGFSLGKCVGRGWKAIQNGKGF